MRASRRWAMRGDSEWPWKLRGEELPLTYRTTGKRVEGLQLTHRLTFRRGSGGSSRVGHGREAAVLAQE